MDLSRNREDNGLQSVELLLQEQRKLLEMIATGVPLDACLEALCIALRHLGPGVRASILITDEEAGSFPRGIAPDLPLAYLELVKGAPVGEPPVGTCAEAVCRGEQVACRDIAKEEKWSQAWKDLCLAHGVRACVSEPILALDGNPLGSLMLGFEEPREPMEWEQRMLKFGTYIASIALTRDRATRALRRSEERYMTLFESIDAGFCVMQLTGGDGIDFRLLEANPMFRKLSGLSDAVGKTTRELMPELEDDWYETLARVATSGESVREEMTFRDRWFQVYAYRVDRPEQRRVAMLFEDITRRKQHESSLAYLAALSQDLAGPGDLDGLMAAAAASIGRFMKVAACALVEIDKEADRLVVAYDWHRDEVPGTAGVYPLGESVGGEFREASGRGQVFLIRGDAAEEARAAPLPTDPLKIRAFLAAPVLRDGGWRFALCVYDPEARDWQADEIELTEQLAYRIWTRLERARAEEALKESERKLRQIFDGAKDYAIFAVDVAGDFTSWSSGAERLFGYEETEILHRHIEIIFTPQDRADQIPHRELERARVNGVAENERWHQRKDGSRFFASGLTQPIMDRGQHVGFTTICRDRTAQHQAREWLELELMDSQRLQAASARLVAESDLSTLLEESLRAAVSITHAEMGTIHLVEGEDDKTLRLLVSSGSGPGALGDSLKLLPQEETSCAAAIREGKRVVVADFADFADVPGHPALEQLATAGVRAGQWTPLFLRPGGLLGVISTYWSHPHQPAERELRLLDQLARQVRDLVERHQTEAKLRDLSATLERRVKQRTAELQEQTARLQSLAAELATAEQRERKRIAALLHDDLQQLLVAASMQLDLVVGHTDEVGDKAAAQAAEWLDEAKNAARDLTRQLRPPALYEDGLVAALHWLASEMKKRHRLEVHIDGHEPARPLSDDIKALLFESVRELLFNVTKYAGVDSADVALREEAEGLEISVSDAGNGFDVDAVGTARQSEGSGLFSIRERLFALGGKMKMISSPGNGTRIELHAPLATGAALEQARRQGALDGVSAAGDHAEGPAHADEQRIEVLVVDDHPMVREGIANIISCDRRLHVSGQARDGIEAIQVAERHPPDVVLMDVNMPRMNGIEATREIHRRWPDMRIIGLSVQDDSTTAKSMCDAGAGAFISKSGNSDCMIAAILGQVPSKTAAAAPAAVGVF